MNRPLISLILTLLLACSAAAQTVRTYPTHPNLFFNPTAKRLSIIDKTPFTFFGGTNYLTIGSQSSLTVPAADNAVGINMVLPWAVSGTTQKNLIGVNTRLTPSGSPAAAANIFGNLTYIFTNAYTPVGGGGSIYGHYVTVDIGFPVATAWGAQFTAAHGSSQAHGAGTILGIQATVGGGHNGDLGTAIAGKFRYATSLSDPLSTTSVAKGIMTEVSTAAGTHTGEYRALELGNVLFANGTFGTVTAIHIDNTLAVGATKNWAINSLHPSPSRFSGDLYISDTTKGIILTSPDGTCYRFTVANGGALSSGAAVTCP